MSDTININGEHYAVHTFRGKVLPNHASSAPEIHTALAKHGKLYLQDSEGKQNVTERVDTRVLEWVGHDVAKIWLAREGDENGITVGFFNATLNKFYWIDGAWQGFNRYPIWFKGLELMSIFIVFGVVFYMKSMVDDWVFQGLFFGLFGVLSLYITWLEKRSSLRARVWQRDIAGILNKQYG